jgi:hypothetical protein
LSTPLSKEQIRYLRDVADLIGSRESLHRTMTLIESALLGSPREWGDPIHNLSGLDMVVYRRFFAELVIVYAVHETRPLVWLHSIEPGPDHLLFGDPHFPAR